MEWFRKPENKYQPIYCLTFFFNKQIFRGIGILTKLSEGITPSGNDVISKRLQHDNTYNVIPDFKIKSESK